MIPINMAEIGSISKAINVISGLIVSIMMSTPIKVAMAEINCVIL